MNIKKLLVVCTLFILVITALFIILPVTPVSPVQKTDSLTIIGNSISGTANGENKLTQMFFVDAKEIFDSSKLMDKGIYKESVCFDSGKIPESMIELSDDCQYFVNKMSTSINLRAQIFCDSTPEKLENLISNSNIGLAGKKPTEVWVSEESYSNYNRLCFVVLKRG